MDFSYRITKYDKYNHEGFLYSDTWSSFYDVGKEITLKEYLETENEYIMVIKNVCKYLNIERFIISDLEIYEENSIEIKNNQKISVHKITEIVQAVLREKIWCKLKCEMCEFHFGYDLYMYCISKLDIFSFIKNSTDVLNVEVFRSPYLE